MNDHSLQSQVDILKERKIYVPEGWTKRAARNEATAINMHLKGEDGHRSAGVIRYETAKRALRKGKNARVQVELPTGKRGKVPIRNIDFFAIKPD